MAFDTSDFLTPDGRGTKEAEDALNRILARRMELGVALPASTDTWQPDLPRTPASWEIVSWQEIAEEMRSNRLVRPCPVCNQIGGEVFHIQHFVGHPYQEIKRCPCGMIYADSGLTQNDYEIHYRDRSKYVALGTVSIPSDRQRFQHIVSWLSPFVPRKSSILDYGCATGELLREFKAAGYDSLSGYDASRTSQEAIRALGFTPTTLGASQFDCVTLSHVLEHIYDVAGIFPQIVHAVKEHGVLYVEVPDTAQYRVMAPFQEFNTEHVNHFTLSSLCALAGRFGLVPLHVGEKRFPVGDGMPYPAIFGVFRKLPKVDLRHYIEKSEILLTAMGERLEWELTGKPDVIVWGAGEFTLKLLELPALKSRRVTLADSNPVLHGQSIGGIYVVPPGTACHMPHPIVVASILNQKSIINSIQELGLSNPVVTLVP